MGLDTLIEIPFDQDISRLEPEMFIQELLVKYFKFSCVVVGEDFKFGFERRGNANLLKDIGRTLNLDVKIAPLVKSHGNEISSTAIRKVLAEGKPEEAAKMLGRWYSIAGIVSKGDQRGRTLGFPTINLQLKNLHLPKFGIYSAIVNVWTGSKKGSYLAVASIGARPTYGEREPNLEAYLFNFSGNLYFEDVEVSLVHFQRPEVKFDSSEQLVEQMKEDCRIAEKTLKKLANI